jgi:phosphopantothenoylcysteine synthetase/decarboxylase
VVLFAPCSFNSLNKLAHGIADSLALSVAMNTPLPAHPEAQI